MATGTGLYPPETLAPLAFDFFSYFSERYNVFINKKTRNRPFFLVSSSAPLITLVYNRKLICPLRHTLTHGLIANIKAHFTALASVFDQNP